MKTKRIAVQEYLRNQTPKKYKRLVGQADAALFGSQYVLCCQGDHAAKQVLRAIGITAPKRGKKGSK